MSAKHKEIIEKVNAAFEANKPEVFLDFCSENVEWQMAGDKVRKGKSSIREWMSSMGDSEPPKIGVTAIISDGDRAACYGSMTIVENGVENSYQYCDLYRFEDEKIAGLDSFVMKNKTEDEGTQKASA